jgi:hypothetical protein
MSTEGERMQILEMIESGKITPAQGVALLEALGREEVSEDVAGSGVIEGQGRVEISAFNPPSEEQVIAEIQAPEPPLPQEAPTAATGETGGTIPPASGPSVETSQPVEGEVLPEKVPQQPNLGYWRNWWRIPLWIGVGITILSGLLMYSVWQSTQMSFWFACTWFPFLFGVAVMALAWSTRNLPWLHLRINQKPGERPQKIAISFPLPTRLMAWLLRTFGHRIPNMENVNNLDEVLLALGKTRPETPISIEVNEGEDGEKVQIYIG